MPALRPEYHPGPATGGGLGIDNSSRGLQELDRPGRRLVEADLAQPLGQIAAVSDAVLALDVIEHLDDDRAAAARLGALGSSASRRYPHCSPSSTPFRASAGATCRKPWARPSPIPAYCWIGSSSGDDGSCQPCSDNAPARARAPARHRRRSTAITSNCPPGPCPGSPDWRSCSNTVRPSAGYCGLVHHCSRWRAAPSPGQTLRLAWQHRPRDLFPQTGAVLAVTDRAGSALRGPGCPSPVRVR